MDEQLTRSAVVSATSKAASPALANRLTQAVKSISLLEGYIYDRQQIIVSYRYSHHLYSLK